MSDAELSVRSPRSALVYGLALGLIGVIAFSLTLPMTRLAVASLGSLPVAIWRGLVAALVASLILLVLRPPRPRGREWFLLSLCAFGTVFGFPLFTTLAMATVSASHGAVVVGLLPLATAVTGVLISDEKPSPAFWLACLCGTCLSVAFVLRQATGGLAIGHVHLLLAVICGGVGYAFGGLCSRRLGGWVVACWSLVICLPLLVVISLFGPGLALDAGWPALSAFLYLALISQLFGFFAWYRGMALAGIARVSQIQLLQLFLTVGFAVAFFGETWNREVLIFGSAVVVVVWITTRLKVRSTEGS